MCKRKQAGRMNRQVLKRVLVLAGLVAGLGSWATAANNPFISASRMVVLTGDKFRVVDAATGKVVSNLAQKRDIRKTALSPDGKTLASAYVDGSVTLWSMATGKPLHVLSGQTDSTTSLAFSPDGKTLASGSDDTTVKLWNVATGKETLTFTGGLEGGLAPVMQSSG